MGKLRTIASALLLLFGAVSVQAQMSPPVSGQFITTPKDAPNFGLTIIPGTQLPTAPICQNAPENTAKQKSICIQIPDDALHRTWWQDQYVDQLVKQGWKSVSPERGEMPRYPEQANAPADMRILTGLRKSGCHSVLVSFPIYDGDYRQFQKKPDMPVEVLNATYLVFAEASSGCPK